MDMHYDILNNWAVKNGYANGAHACVLMGMEKALKGAGFRYSDSECGGPSFYWHESVGFIDAMKADPKMRNLEKAKNISFYMKHYEEKLEKLRNELRALEF